MAWDQHQALEDWRNRIERDLAPFADPNTTLELVEEGRSISVTWAQRGVQREARFRVSVEGCDVTEGARVTDYKSFFSGPNMGDLLGLAKMILQSRPGPTEWGAGRSVLERRTQTGLPPVYVDTRAHRASGPPARHGTATRVLHDALDDPWGDDATLVVMVTGEAGAGKTSVLQHLVTTRADDFVRGRSRSLFLYVNAQGRALARFHEALAIELQDLRANLTYHGVSTLVRLGLLVPVIDGFDELLGVSGYDDAFSSLAAFIEELDGRGKLLASARSSYYEQEFVARANRVSALGAQVWKQIPVEVLAWGDAEFDQYLSEVCRHWDLDGVAAAHLKDRVTKVFAGRNAALRTKPLFVARTVGLALSNVDLSGEGDLLGQLVRGYLDRERTEKLLDRNQTPLLTVEQLRALLVNLAEEMWNQETRELDRRSVREVAEYVLVVGNVPESVQRIVIERMPTLAFLTPGEKAGAVSFEHEIFFSHFLSDRFEEVLRADAALPASLMGRSVLPGDLAEACARDLVGDKATTRKMLEKLGQAGAGTSPRTQQIRENCGILCAALLRSSPPFDPTDAIAIRHLVFPGGNLNGVVLDGASLEDIQFRRVDLTRTRFLSCRVLDVMLLEVLVDPKQTRLELVGLDVDQQVVGLRTVGTPEVIFHPDELRAVLVQVGAAQPQASAGPQLRRVNEPQLTTLERFVRAYNRCNPVCTGDDNMKGVFQDQDWPTIQRLLLDSGVVTREDKATGGRPKTFLRRQVQPQEIMHGLNRNASVPRQVSVFWDEFERRFPA